ncbi:MAG: hypothetical protein LBR75_07005 [Prevotellaceae bacterium]|jgi:hypothetical protein|nr:hypothetical protein [Prevotellaceae bacterium]
MIFVIGKLVMKVKEEKGKDYGRKVALEGLRFMFKLLNNSDMDFNGNGSSKSKYLDKKQAKTSKESSERFDYEFAGWGGRDILDNVTVTQIIKKI